MAQNRKIRVAHIVTRMNVGGVAVLIDNLLTNYDRERFEITLISGVCQSPENEYLAGGLPNYEVLYLPSLRKTTGIYQTIIAFKDIYVALKQMAPDIVHTHTSKAGVLGRLASFLANPNAIRIHTFHGHLLVGYFSPLKVKLVTTVERAMALITHTLIAMGTQVKNDLVNVRISKSERFRVLYPGLKQPARLNKIESRLGLSLKMDTLYCTFIGRLTQVKRPDRLLDVVRICKESNSGIYFLIVGDGELFKNIKEQIAVENLPVTMLGWRSDINQILCASDFAILTSDNEAVALTLIEASQAGIPLVTTPAGSVRDIAIDGKNGIVADFSPTSLAAALIKLEQSPKLRESMGEWGREIASTRFSIAQMTNNHQDLYLETLKVL